MVCARITILATLIAALSCVLLARSTALAAPPANDNLADAQAIPLHSDTFFNTFEATMTGESPRPGRASPGATVWYKYTSPDEPSPDAWPPDFNDNQSVSITDVLFMKFYFNQTCAPWA